MKANEQFIGNLKIINLVESNKIGEGTNFSSFCHTFCDFS